MADDVVELARRLRSLERQRWLLALGIVVAVGVGIDARRRADRVPPPLADLTVRGSIRVVDDHGAAGVELTAGTGTGAVEVHGQDQQMARLSVIVDPRLELRGKETTALLGAEDDARLRLSKRVGETYHLLHLDVGEQATSLDAQGPNRRSMSMRLGGERGEIELLHFGQEVWRAGDRPARD